MVRRVVLDTNVVVAGLRSRRGASAVVLDLLERRDLRAIVSLPLLEEYEEVLRRSEQRRAHGLSDEDLDRFLRGVIDRAELVPTRPERRLALTRDPDDAVVAEAAIDAAVDHLVTHNLRHFAEVTDLVHVVAPGELLRIMAG